MPAGTDATPTSAAISPGQDAVVTFAAEAGDRMYFLCSNDTGQSISAEMTGPAGATKEYGLCSTAEQTMFGSAASKPLAATGTYTIRFAHSGVLTGAVKVKIQKVGPEVVVPAETDGTPVTVTTTTPLQTGGVTFDAERRAGVLHHLR